MSSTIGRIASKNAVHCQLWMGGVEPYMTEGFILTAFQRMGENPRSVKIMRNRMTGELMGYCFVHFGDDDEAIKAMHKINGKVIPDTNPPVRFRLNNATTGKDKKVQLEREFSLWVGDFSTDVDDYQLYKTFASRYESLRAAKVVIDSAGHSRGYGFIRFASEDEQKHCLVSMNGYKGLGSRPLRISSAIPKSHRLASTSMMTGGYSGQDYSPYYNTDNYWQNYSAWQNYYDNPASTPGAQQAPVETIVVSEEDDLELIDHNTTCDIEAWNREVMERDYNLWDALESSKWLPLETYG